MLPAVAHAADSWDGAWGNGSPLVSVSGHTISYSYAGRAYPVSAVSMSPARLAFHAGQATVVMSRTPDGKADFNFMMNGQTSDFVIWKQ